MSIRFANVAGRAVLLVGDGMIDVGQSSGGAFSSDPTAAVAEWDVFAEWARGRTSAGIRSSLVRRCASRAR